ncbi:MAG: DUF1684 domain-containing protein [Propionibacteriales bacterium]|nr:DUF1684 domain-containing protein [Propionibacteriales bacterium]
MAANWAVLDWRRRVGDLYRQVRSAAHPADGHATWVSGRDDLLRHHPASPVPQNARAAYPGTDVAPYDIAFRYVVAVDADVEPQSRDVATGTDGVARFDLLGRILLPDVGELDVWWLGSYGGGVFLPVKDTGGASYGGGRYLLDTVKGADLGGADDSLVVDLNFAYQPSCAYDEAWACPLAGPTNTVPVALPVGERYRALD